MNVNQLLQRFTGQGSLAGKALKVEPMSADELADIVGGNQFLSKIQQAELEHPFPPVFQSAIDEFLAANEED